MNWKFVKYLRKIDIAFVFISYTQLHTFTHKKQVNSAQQNGEFLSNI